jgi:hypothetical protein
VADDTLFKGMFAADPAVAAVAIRLYKQSHEFAEESIPRREPPHCSECFEGCPKCQK